MKHIGFVGTYTKGESKGIYSFELDTTAERITSVKLAAECEQPTYLAISTDNQFLYSVVKNETEGGVAAFSLNKKTGELSPLNKHITNGAPPCHVSVDAGNRYLLAANYHKGTAIAYQLKLADGKIHSLIAEAVHEGTGPDTRQEKAHAHYAAFTPDMEYIVAVDLGNDTLYTYKLLEKELVEVARLNVKAGSGPRHLAFHPSKPLAYLMTEFSSEVIVLDYNDEAGSFTAKQTLSTVPSDFKDNNQGSAIHLSTDGQFVYTGNRGHNSIAVFRVDVHSGELSLVEIADTAGNWPRDFALDPSNHYVVAANQESSNLVLFARDTVTGKLTLLQSDIYVPEAVCVKFLNL